MTLKLMDPLPDGTGTGAVSKAWKTWQGKFTLPAISKENPQIGASGFKDNRHQQRQVFLPADCGAMNKKPKATSPGVCPCCKRPLPPDIKLRGPIQQKYFDVIARHDGLSVWQILDLVYSSMPSGGPEDHNVVSVTCHQINKQIRPQGYEIRSNGRGGPGSVYKLVQL